MYRIYTRSGDLVRWAPSFATRAEAEAWLESATFGWDGGEEPLEVYED